MTNEEVFEGFFLNRFPIKVSWLECEADGQVLKIKSTSKQKVIIRIFFV